MEIRTHSVKRFFSPSLFALCVALTTWPSSSMKSTSPSVELPVHQREFLNWGRSQIAQIFQTEEGERDQKIRQFKKELAAKKKSEKVKQRLVEELQQALAAKNEEETALWQEQRRQRRAVLPALFLVAALAALAMGFSRYRHTKSRRADAAPAQATTAVPTQSLLDLSYGEKYDFMFPEEESVPLESKIHEKEKQIVRSHAP